MIFRLLGASGCKPWSAGEMVPGKCQKFNKKRHLVDVKDKSLLG